MYEIKDGLDNIAEYSVKKRREGEYEQRRRLAIVLMAAFAVASAVVCILLFGIMFPAWLIFDRDTAYLPAEFQYRVRLPRRRRGA